MFNRFIQAASVFGISAIVLLTVIGLASRSDTAAAAPNAADAAASNVIVVSGAGTVTTQPDQATITIGVQITAPTLEAATQQASDSMTKVLDAIKAQGIDAKDIQTSNYSVNPITNFQNGQTAQVTGYQVSNIVTVTVKNLANLGHVLDAGVGAGANYLGGVIFDVADPAPFQSQARTKAVQNAAQIAQTLAQAAGVKLGPVISITEGVSAPPVPLPAKTFAASDAVAPGPVESGSLQITSNVEMRFQISQ